MLGGKQYSLRKMLRNAQISGYMRQSAHFLNMRDFIIIGI